MRLDLKDRKILTLLDMDARMPLSQLAKRVGVSRQVADYRIDRMKKNNIIFGSHAIFDSVVAGFKWFRVVFRLKGATKEEKESFMLSLSHHPHLIWLGELGGNWDAIINVIAKDTFEFNKIFEGIIEEYGHHILDYEILIYLYINDLDRSYLLEASQTKQQERKIFWHEMKINRKLASSLDYLDFEIIARLSKDADVSNVELANTLDVSPNTIKNRLDSMKENKLLLGYRLFINPAVLNYSSHLLFLEITRLDLEKEKELIAYARMLPQVVYIVKHIGRWRIGLEIETKSQEEFQEIFVNIRGNFSDIITNFESFPILKDRAINYFPEVVWKE